MFHYKFDKLPPYIPIQVHKLKEMGWNKEGYLVPLSEGGQKHAYLSYWSTDVTKPEKEPQTSGTTDKVK